MSPHMNMAENQLSAIADRSLAGRGSASSGIERMHPLLTTRIERQFSREAVTFNPAP